MKENSYDQLLRELYSSLVSPSGFIDFLIQLNKYSHLKISCIEIFSKHYQLDDNFWLVKENGSDKQYGCPQPMENRNDLITSLHQASLYELVEIEESNNSSNTRYSIVLVNNADWVCRIYFKHNTINHHFSLEDNQLLLNALPHIQHAIRLYINKLNFNKTHLFQSLLFEQTSFPIIILDDLGDMQDCNLQAKKILKKHPILQEVDIKFYTNRHNAKEKSPIQEIIVKCRAEKEAQVLVLNLENNCELILSFIPLLQTKIIPQSGLAIFIYNRKKIDINQDVLCQLYDLTVKEAMVCNELIAGLSLAEIATVTYLSYQTVRTYIKCIMAKTSTSRQGELIIKILTSPACNLIYKTEK
jgi:DNA-binding CsgD family transcriptional regulator